MTTMLEEVLYTRPDKSIEKVTLNRGLVQDRLKTNLADEDLRQ